MTTERNAPNINGFLMFFGHANQTSYHPPNILSPSFFKKRKQKSKKHTKTKTKNTEKKKHENKKNNKKNTK